MAGSSQRLINLLSQTAHSATICGQTGCGKTVFILDLLKGPYRGFFQHIVVLCPTVRHNKTDQQCPWIWTDPEVYLLDLGERLHDYLRAFYHVRTDVAYHRCLFGFDSVNEEKGYVGNACFLGPPCRAICLGLTQKYNFVLKDLREQLRWVCFFPLRGSRFIPGLSA